MADNDDYMEAKATGNVITENMWDRLQEGINANRRFRLKGVAGGDDMKYDTTKVVWSSDIYIYFTRESDGAWVYNKINTNPTTGITCGDNDLLYVTLSDTTTTVLTVSSADYTSMPTDDTGRILILGAVSASTWYGNVIGGGGGWVNPAEEDLEMGTYNINFTTLAEIEVGGTPIWNAGASAMRLLPGIAGDVYVGGTANVNLHTRHVDGKEAASEAYDILYLNYNADEGDGVYIGQTGRTNQFLSVFGPLTLATIAAESTDVDKFLVSNAGLVKYRTGAQVLSDIGAGGGGSPWNQDDIKDVNRDIASANVEPALWLFPHNTEVSIWDLNTPHVSFRVGLGATLAGTDFWYGWHSAASAGSNGEGKGYSIDFAMPETQAYTADIALYAVTNSGAYWGYRVYLDSTSKYGAQPTTNTFQTISVALGTLTADQVYTLRFGVGCFQSLAGPHSCNMYTHAIYIRQTTAG